MSCAPQKAHMNRRNTHGGWYRNNTLRSRNQNHSQRRSRALGTAVFRADLLNGRIESLFEANNRIRRVAGRAVRFLRCAVVRSAGTRGRPQHTAWLSRKDRRVADYVVSHPGDAHDAQVLDGARSNDGTNADGHVHEERCHSRWRIAHLAVRIRAVESRRTAFTLKRSLHSASIECHQEMNMFKI